MGFEVLDILGGIVEVCGPDDLGIRERKRALDFFLHGVGSKLCPIRIGCIGFQFGGPRIFHHEYRCRYK